MTNIEVLNKMEVIAEDTPIINVSMSNAIYRGPKGDKGEDGSIVFEELTPEQKEELRGPAGPPGPAGVYIGAEEPTDKEMNVWIDIDGGENVDIATQQWVNEQIAAIPQPDLDDYALKTEIPDTTGFITMPEVEEKGYQTEEQVNALIEANGGGKEVDLSGYYTKEDISTILKELSQFGTKNLIAKNTTITLASSSITPQQNMPSLNVYGIIKWDLEDDWIYGAGTKGSSIIKGSEVKKYFKKGHYYVFKRNNMSAYNNLKTMFGNDFVTIADKYLGICNYANIDYSYIEDEDVALYCNSSYVFTVRDVTSWYGDYEARLSALENVGVAEEGTF